MSNSDCSSGDGSVNLADNLIYSDTISILTEHDLFKDNDEEGKSVLKESIASGTLNLEIGHKGCDTFSLDDEISDHESSKNSFFSFTPSDDASNMLTSDGSSLTLDFLNMYSPFYSSLATDTHKEIPRFISAPFACLCEADRSENTSIYDTSSVDYTPEQPLVITSSLLLEYPNVSSGAIIVSPNLSDNMDHKHFGGRSKSEHEDERETDTAVSNLDIDQASEEKAGSSVGKLVDLFPFAGWSCLGNEDERSIITNGATLVDHKEEGSFDAVTFENAVSTKESEDREQRQEGDCWMEDMDDCLDREDLEHEKLQGILLHSIPMLNVMHFIPEECDTNRNELQGFGTIVSENSGLANSVKFEDSSDGITTVDNHNVLLFAEEQNILKPVSDCNTLQELGTEALMS